MANKRELQPRYLTLTELVANLSLFAAIGYWAAGTKGACIGAALMLSRYAYLIWLACRVPGSAQSNARSSDSKLGAAADVFKGN
jgi:hypothetical protein